MIRNGLAFLIADSLELEDVSEDQWQATLDFAVPEFQSAVNQPKQVGECTFSFDGTGGRVLIKEAYAQRKYGENAPTHNGGINVVDGVAEGVEIVIPALAFNVTQKFEGATITLPWLRQIIFAAGTVNSDRFLGFEPGEVLFLGPSGSQPFAFMADGTVSFGEREVEFRFAVSPNLKGLKIGDIEDIDKDGHDYLWIESVPAKDSLTSLRASRQSRLACMSLKFIVAYRSACWVSTIHLKTFRWPNV